MFIPSSEHMKFQGLIVSVFPIDVRMRRSAKPIVSFPCGSELYARKKQLNRTALPTLSMRVKIRDGANIPWVGIRYSACQQERPIQHVSANYHKPGLPATTYLVHNTNYMNNIFKPEIDQLHLDVCVVVVHKVRMHTQHRALVYFCIVEVALTTSNQQFKATDCYKLSLLISILSK